MKRGSRRGKSSNRWRKTERLQLGGWRIDYDREATVRAYESCVGAPEKCTTDECRNFILARDRAYPPEVIALLDRLGIDRRCEAELYHIARVAPGLHLYGGWFHFVGSLETAADSLERLGEDFLLWFRSDTTLVAESFARLPVVQLDFTTVVPWVLDVPEPVSAPSPSRQSWFRALLRRAGGLWNRWRSRL